MSGKGTPVRKVRMPDEVWDPGMVKAAAEGTTLSVVTREAVLAFLAAPPRTWPAQAPGVPIGTPDGPSEDADR